MKKEEVVKNNREFDYIIKKGGCKKNNEYVVYYIDNDKKSDRFGISVSKKIGNAVTRNYYKRIIRNIVDNHKKLYSNGKDYIIILRKACIEMNFKEIEDSFLQLIGKIEKERENEK